MLHRSLGHRAPLLWLVLPFIGGLAIAKLAGFTSAVPWLVAAGCTAAAALVLVSRAPRMWAAAIVIAMGCAGSASYVLHRARLPAWDEFPPREARLELRVDRAFAQTDPRKTSGLATIVAADAHLGELAGQRLYFSIGLRKDETAPLRSAVVSAVGVLVTLPRNPPADSFDAYLSDSGMNFRLTRGRVVASVREPSRYYVLCQRAVEKFAALLSLGTAEKQPVLTGVLRAMLLGQKHELSDDHDTLFMRSGTMHLFAISGLHIGVIALALHAAIGLLRFPRAVQFAITIVALWLYVDITGGTPSAVRAFIMVALVEASLLLRAPGNPLSALALSAGIVAVVWPMQVFSASFQMSYGIVAALLLLGLPLADSWQERWKLFAVLPKPAWRWYHHVLEWFHRKTIAAVAIGVASTLVSTLYGVLFFKLFTPASLLANLVLIPVSSFVILGGFVSLLAGLAGVTALSAFFNHASVLVLWVIDAGLRAFVAVPGTWQTAQFVTPWWGPGALVALFATFVLGYRAGWRGKRGGWWPPFAVVAIALIFGVKFGD